MPIILKESCSTCQHYDGDHYCAFPSLKVLIPGHIPEPARVVCDLHDEKPVGDDDDGA